MLLLILLLTIALTSAADACSRSAPPPTLQQLIRASDTIVVARAVSYRPQQKPISEYEPVGHVKMQVLSTLKGKLSKPSFELWGRVDEFEGRFGVADDGRISYNGTTDCSEGDEYPLGMSFILLIKHDFSAPEYDILMRRPVMGIQDPGVCEIRTEMDFMRIPGNTADSTQYCETLINTTCLLPGAILALLFVLCLSIGARKLNRPFVRKSK